MIRGKEDDLYIPFMMNDAVEAYCHFTDTVIPGLLPDDLSMVTDIGMSQNGNRFGLFLRSGTSLQAAIWFGSCSYTEDLYQYHRIMHCWEKGCEHMRMLVYMIGTIRDKYEYIGPEACNEMEKSLIPLMEYHPFTSFSPISESIESWYPETEAGYEAMKAFVFEAGDEELLRLLKNRGLASSIYSGRIRDRLAKSDKLFWLLYGKICSGSACYQERVYEGRMSDVIVQKRLKVQDNLSKKGYQGKYPTFRKEDSVLTVFEEHPFVLAQMDDLAFGMHILEYREGNKDQPFQLWEV